ncbi:MAG: hypothetical protein AUI09_04065 [Gemmatimonadetes bacterium 13_2_20CM_2_66_5]|nr:MAG: hypothetical protein AUI09_04065 [Gemmatimonadetes bacterium 13_2_20CM_2_66_5]
MPLALRALLVMLHRLDPHFDPREGAIVHIRAHSVQHAREVLGSFQQRVDGHDHVRQQLAL